GPVAVLDKNVNAHAERMVRHGTPPCPPRLTRRSVPRVLRCGRSGMSAKVKEVRTHEGKPYGWTFRCPGCNDWHVLKDWTFNGNLEKPTFSPSVLVHPHQALADDDKTVITTP